MMLVKKLLNNKNTKAGTFYLVGNLFNKAIVFLTIPIFTRLLSTYDYGVVNTYLSWVSILTVIVGLSLGSSIRTAHIDYKDNIDKYISSIFFLALLNFLVTSIFIIFIVYFYISELDIILVVLCLIQSFMTFILNSIDIKYMMNLEYLKRTYLLAIPNIIIVFVSVIVLLNIKDSNYYGRIIPYVFITSIVGMSYLFLYFIKGRMFINKDYWKYAVSLSLPLVFHGLSVNVLATSDRTMITIFQDASQTGIYSLVYSLGMIALVVTTSLESVWIPWFTEKLQNGDRDIINKNVKFYIEIVMIVMILILMAGPEILVLMAPKEYWSGKVLIPPIVLSSFFIFLYSISVDLEYYYKSTKTIALNTIIAASINLGLNFIFIPLFGVVAAAYTTVFAYMISFLIHHYAARKLDNELFPFGIYIKPLVIIIISIMVSYITINETLIRWTIIFLGAVLYLVISYKKQRLSGLFK